MENKDEQSKQNEANRGQGPGRTEQDSDISRVDRQEGEMDNGELGGNMGQKKDEPASRQGRS